jgi:hypothetical protein
MVLQRFHTFSYAIRNTNGSNEPILQKFCNAANGSYCWIGRNLQQLLYFGMGFLIVQIKVVGACSIRKGLLQKYASEGHVNRNIFSTKLALEDDVPNF